jgi:translation initiation factor 1
MSEICTTCGLPKELCVCETIAKEAQKIVVTTTKKKFGKVYTVI